MREATQETEKNVRGTSEKQSKNIRTTSEECDLRGTCEEHQRNMFVM